MKEIDINLLPAATRFELQAIKLEKKLKKLAGIVVLIWLVILGLVVAGRLFFRFRLSALESSKQNVNNALEQFSPQASLQQALRLRLKLAADVLEKRPLFYDSFNQLISYLPEETNINRLDLKAKAITLGGSVPDLIYLDRLEQDLKKLEREENYTKIDLTGLGQDEFGRWNFVLEVRE